MAAPEWLVPSTQNEGPEWLDKRPRTTFEEESGFQNIPEGSRVQTLRTDTGDRVEGYAYPQLGQVALGHTPLTQAPGPKKTPWDIPQAFAQGTKRGVAGIGGMPVDVVNALAGLAVGRKSGLVEKPIGGSQSLMDLFKAVNIPDVQLPESPVNTLAGVAGEYLPGAITFPAAIGARSGQALQSIRQGLTPTLGSVAGVTGARELYPDNPLVEMGAALTGGFGAPAITAASKQAANLTPLSIEKHLFRISKPTPTEVRDAGGMKNLIRTQQKGAEEIARIGKARGGYTFTDLDGQTVRKGLPETVMELEEALPHAKASVYEQFHAKQTAAGKQGLTFDGDRIVNRVMSEIFDVPDAPPSVTALRPQAENMLKDRYAGKQFTPQQFENEMAVLNAQKKAFQKSQNPNDVSINEVTKKVYDILGDELDNGIRRITGADNYKDIRAKYAAIKSIENRVRNASLKQRVEQARNTGLDRSDLLYAGAGVTGALATGDLRTALPAAAIIGARHARSTFLDPDRNVKALFQKLDKTVKPAENWGPLLKPERPMPQTDEGRLLGAPTYEGEIVLPQRTLPPLPANRLEYTGRTGSAPIEADWKPVNRPGAAASRIGTIQQGPDTNLDTNGAIKSLVEKGFSPEDARLMVWESVKAEMKRRGMLK